MYKNLADFKDAMDKFDLPFILIFGALMGLMRAKDLIEWDTDIDVACFNEYKSKIMNVIKEMENKGFKLQENTPDHDTNFIRHGEKIEIWWFDKIGDKWVYDHNIRYNERFFDKTETVKFLDRVWVVPSNTEQFLDTTYGMDWRIPNKNKGYILRGD